MIVTTIIGRMSKDQSSGSKKFCERNNGRYRPTQQLVIKLMSRQFGLVQGCNKNGWFLKRQLSKNDSEVKIGTQIELEWVRSQKLSSSRPSFSRV